MSKIRSAYSKKTRKGFTCSGPSMTKQSFKAECDINTLLAKYQKTGMLAHTSRFQGDYSDLTDSVDYHTAMNIVLDAQNAFDTLPSSVRAKFNNDPSEFLTFVSDENNLDEMREMGLTENGPVSGEVVPDLSGTASPDAPQATPPAEGGSE